MMSLILVVAFYAKIINLINFKKGIFMLFILKLKACYKKLAGSPYRLSYDLAQSKSNYHQVTYVYTYRTADPSTILTYVNKFLVKGVVIKNQSDKEAFNEYINTPPIKRSKRIYFNDINEFINAVNEAEATLNNINRIKSKGNKSYA